MPIHARPTPRSIGQAVAELRRTFPDVSSSSLRFLEREGLIHPLRTPGGHRLFHAGDIARVRRIKEWQERRLSLTEIRDRLETADTLSAPALNQRFLDSAIRGDRGEAARSMLTADDLGLPLEESFGNVLAPALVDVGERWADGTLQVGQEHEISALAADLVAELTFRHARSTPGHPGVVAACVEHERHDIGLRIIAGLLRARGLHLHFLGADVTSAILVETIQLRRPAIVLLSATLPPHVEELVETISVVRAVEDRQRIIAGGQACQGSAATVRAAGAEVPEAVNLVELIDHIVALAEMDDRREPAEG
jgi:methanogenic corrinoid protein MtbC1